MSMVAGRLLRFSLLFTLCALLFAGGAARSATPRVPTLDGAPLAAVIWPPSTGLLVSELVTGGASASDEFIELYNASSATLDLGGLELVYVTSTGGTVTKKQSWTALAVPAHRHVLIANSSGVWAAGADGLYSGGLSATGGSIVLRKTDGTVVDSLSWGDATNSFVEGTAGAAPPASASLERRPGGAAGNATDSNVNSADAQVQSAPVAQNLAADPVPPLAASPLPSITATPSPPPTSTPAATPTAMDTPTPEPTQTPEATPPCTPATDTPSPEPTIEVTPQPTAPPTPEPTAPLATPTPDASASPDATSSPPPTAQPSATPDATATPSPTPTQTPTLTPTPTPTPTATIPPISAVRSSALGTQVSVRGVVTVPFGLLDGGQRTYMQDQTAGVALSFAGFAPSAAQVGQDIVAQGTLASQDGELTVVIPSPSALAATSGDAIPSAVTLATVLACEPFESQLISVEGTLVAAPG